MACDLTLISAYLDNELNEPERMDLEAHLKTCPACAAELRQLREARAFVLRLPAEPGFHDALMARVAAEEARRARRVWMSVAAAAAVVCLAAAWLAFNALPALPSEPAPGARLGASQPTTEGVEPEAMPEAVAHEDAPEEAPTDLAVAAAPLPLSLQGTTTGPNPMATIRNTDTGESNVYGVGEAVLPGVVVASIERGSVTLEHDQESTTLALANAPREELPSLNGIWRLTASWLVNGEERRATDYDKDLVLTEQPGGQIVMTTVGNDEPWALATLQGNRVLVEPQPRAHWAEGVAEGEFNPARTQLLARLEDAERHLTLLCRLDKLSSDEEASRLRVEECREEVAIIAKGLVAYANDHEGRFPDVLAALAPKYVADPASLQNTKAKGLFYYPGSRCPLVPFSADNDGTPKWAAFHPDLPMAERLMLWEESLATALGRDLVVRKLVLRAEYRDVPCTILADSYGKVEVEDDADDGVPSDERLAKMRRGCQNNLKQLGLVVKMFMVEHENVSPPGWLSTYPEYVTDNRIFTSPKDPIGTDSYLYLFPATNYDEVAAELAGAPDVTVDSAAVVGHTGELRPGDSQRVAVHVALSEMPILMNRTDFPGDRPGRNVLFADGHVEYILSGQLRERLGPWLDAAGVAVP